MQNLLRFLLRIHLLLLFVLLEFISVSLLINHNYFQKAKFINYSRELSGKYNKKLSNLQSYFSLQEENDRLTEENVRLNDLLSQMTYNLKYDLNEYIDSFTVERYQYMHASVINNSTNKQRNYITLNIGSKMGIASEMPVTNSYGVVGVTIGVSENFATVIPIINLDYRISAKIMKNDYFGSLQWTGDNIDEAILNEIPLHADISIGDTIITSGYGSIYPEGIIIGFIKDFDGIGGTFYKIDVDLAVDFRNISSVNIIKDILREELIKLDSLAND